jgi:hypothetical protein
MTRIYKTFRRRGVQVKIGLAEIISTCHEIGDDAIVNNKELMTFTRRLWVSISW